MSVSRVLARISPAQPWGVDVPELPIDRLAQAALNVVDDLNGAIWQATTRRELIVLRALAERLIAQLDTSSCVALTLDEHFEERNT